MGQVSDILGKTVTQVEGMREGSDRVIFTCSDSSRYIMYHHQDCCEDVRLEEVIGNPDDLLGEIVEARESSNHDDTGEFESATWTFYNLGTQKGFVTLRWLGTSNGFYGEEVDFEPYDAHYHEDFCY